MRYIRQRDNANWQFRYYTSNENVSFTHNDLDKVIDYRNNYLKYDPDIKPEIPKILFIDIETSPMETYVFNPRTEYIHYRNVKKDWYLMCFSWKWLGDKKTNVKALCDFENYSESDSTEYQLVLLLSELMNEANVIVAHNGDRFDIRAINTKLFQYKIYRPSPYETVDTLKVYRKHFKLSYNHLDYISKFLNREGKIEHAGIDMWINCMNGDMSMWSKMKKYNMRDIEELEQIYLAVRGWDSGHPNLNLYISNDGIKRCGNCLSDNIDRFFEQS